MANQYVKQYQNVMEFTLALYDKYVEICPEEIWNEKFGGWPICQQCYHALWASGMMMASINGRQVVEPESPFPLNASNKTMPSKQDVKGMIAGIKSAYSQLLGELENEALLQPDEPLASKLGRPVTNGEALELIVAHLQYHLGSCDAALREKNLEGSW